MPQVHDRTNADLPINSIVADAIVDDPLEHGAKLRVLRSVRDDPLAGMHARGQIDDAMLAAGRRWQRHHEDSEIGGVSAIDPSKEAVDGGRFPEFDTDRQRQAVLEIKGADTELGLYGSSLIRDVLARRMSILEIAHARHMTRQLEIKYIGRRFRECLDTLAVHWNFAGKRIT